MLSKENIFEFLKITVGTIIVGIAVYFFMLPSHLSVGSVAALAMMLSNFIPLTVSQITMIINVGLLIIGFLLIGPEFGIKTVYCAVLLPAVLGVFERLLPDFQSITQDPLLDVVCYILVVGVGLAILFSANASSGGLDIVAKLLNKFLHMDLGMAMTVSGMCVAVSSIFFYDIKTAILSVFGTYFNGVVLDYFILGFYLKKRVCIISRKQEEIRNFIVNELHSGATIYEAVGAYNNENKSEIVTIVDKQEYAKLMSFIAKTDDAAFVTVYNVNKVIYRPKVKSRTPCPGDPLRFPGLIHV